MERYRWRWRRAAVSLGLVLAGLAPAGAHLAVAAQDDGTTGAVAGHVYDSNGNLLGGAQIIVVDLLGVNGVAADDGGYFIGGVPATDHLVVGQIGDVISDPIAVIVPANDIAFLDIVLSVPPPPPPPPSAPPLGDTPPPPPPPAPTATPAARVVTLSGMVKDDQGAAPPSGTRVQLFDLPALTTNVGGDGSFTLSGIPAGVTHFVYASAPQKAPSDLQTVNFGSDPVRNFSLNLKPFAGGGNPTEFSGRVVFSGGGSGVGDATVWRLGAAGRTTTASNGTFVLIDATRQSADANSALGKPPDNVTLVAARDDRWGFLNINTSNPPAPMIIAMTHQGTPPAPPTAFNWKSNFSANQGEFFTARWKSGNHKNLGIRLVLPDKSVINPGGNGTAQCVGDCSNLSNSLGLVVGLPRDKSFTIQAWNEDVGGDGAPEPNPDWEEAEVVSR